VEIEKKRKKDKSENEKRARRGGGGRNSHKTEFFLKRQIVKNEKERRVH
jgi:hypothetical protein